MKKIVVLGGGTGLSTLLRGLKYFPIDITAIVSTADDGSSTGILRKEFNTPAVGDLRNVLVSLSEVEPLVEKLLQYRFKTNSDLNNHAMGNLLLTALFNITGNLTDSLEAMSKILNIKGKVLPFSEDKAILCAHTLDNEIIVGESKITKAGKKIDYIEYKNKVRATKEVIEALKKADLIIFGIGSLFTSIIPNLLDERVKKTIINSKAKKMYICNIMMQHGETDDYKASDCIRQINKHLGKDIIDVVITNNTLVPNSVLSLYKEEKSKQIEVDDINIKNMNIELIKDDLLEIKNNQARHDSIKTALAIFTYITKGDHL